MTKPRSTVATVAEVALSIGYGPTIADKLVGLFDKANKDIEGKSEDQISQQLHHERMKSEMLQVQAKAAFEFALANRIVTAREVEVEEYYEGTGSGGVGVNLAEQTLGVQGKGLKVTRRIVRLRGWPESPNGESSVETQASTEAKDS